MKKLIQITSIVGILAIATVFGVIASNYDATPQLGSAALLSLDLEDQLNQTDYAIIGVVKEVGQPYPDKNAHEGTSRYFSDVIVTVEEDLYGTITDKEITIRILELMRQSPKFEQGERALLFLEAGQPGSIQGEGVYVVSGMFQGKYTIQDGIVQDPKHEELTYNVNELKSQVISNRG